MATFFIALICVALNIVAVADAAVDAPDITFAAVFKFFSFCSSPLRVASVFATALVIVPTTPVPIPIPDAMAAPVARLFIGFTSTYS